MNSWTPILLSCCLLLCWSARASCRFRDDAQKVYSLSGPVTSALKHFGLLEHPALKGISAFYPTQQKKLAVKILPGGVFLAPELKKDLDGSVVFFDESQELRKLFPFTSSSVRGIEIKTRGLMPLEVTELVIGSFGHILVGCEAQMASFREQTLKLQAELKVAIKQPLGVVFFLGEYSTGKLPSMVIAHDGVVKWLKQEKEIVSYPSELPYVNWSARVLRSLPKQTLHVAVSDSRREDSKEVKKISATQMSVSYPGALTPGIDQLAAWLFWAKSL